MTSVRNPEQLSLDSRLKGVFEDEVGRLVLANAILNDRQYEVQSIRELVRSKEVKERGVHYLEHEGLEFTTEGGESWKVYGSPVSSPQRDRLLKTGYSLTFSVPGSTSICRRSIPIRS